MFRLLLAALAAPLVAFASPVNLSKRTAGRATYYQTGMGACGQFNQPSDFIVAMNSAQYGGGYPSPNCFRGITIHYNGKSAHATVTDECPYGACGYGDLDLSQGLFEFFEPTSAGVFYMNWEWDGEGGAPPPPPPPPPVQSTSVYTPPPVDTHTPPPATSTSAATSSVPPDVTAESFNGETPQNEAPATGNALSGLGVAAGYLVNMLNIAHGA